MRSLPTEQRANFLTGLTADEVARLWYDWLFWARPEQRTPEGQWRAWLIEAGRGFGKTRTGAEWVREQLALGRRRLALVGATAADCRDVMVEGESGVLATSPPWFYPKYEPSKRRLTWPNSAIATLYSADEPARLRGPQHDAAWADEFAIWRFPQAMDMLLLGLRLGPDPRLVVTTTPKPTRAYLKFRGRKRLVITGGSTYANLANLAPQFAEDVLAEYEGTTIGEQELHARLLTDNPDALWRREPMIEQHRVATTPQLDRVVVAIDPPGSSTGAEAGIVGVGRARVGRVPHFYVLGDSSLRGSPHQWGTAGVALYSTLHADRLVGETNNGGEMVEATVRAVDANVSYKAVHASRGKAVRAEPVAALYEQGRVHHVGVFAQLEDQLCQWVPGDESPDRLDALVWAVTELLSGAGGWARGMGG